MTLDNIAGFVGLLAKQGSEWNPTAFFDVNVERWQPIWDAAPESSKRSLAHAYLWAHANFQDSRYLNDNRHYWAENVWTGQFEWFRQIKQYVDLDYINKENLGNGYDWIATVFGVHLWESKQKEYVSMHTLWFGDTDEQKAALQSLVDDLKGAPFFATGNLIPVLAWDLAERTKDSQIYANAIVASYYAGKEGYKPPVLTNDVHKAWATLGFLDNKSARWPSAGKKKSNDERMSKDEAWASEFTDNNLMTPAELISNLQKTTTKGAAEAMRLLLPIIGLDCGEDGYAVYGHTYFGHLLEDPDGNTMAYDVLRTVAPGANNIWNSAELVGQHVFDAISTVVDGHKSNAVDVSLPTDVLAFGD